MSTNFATRRRPGATPRQSPHHDAPLDNYGDLRRPDPFDRAPRHRSAAPERRHPAARARLPGLRHARRDGGRRNRDRQPAGRDFLLIRRHAAGAGRNGSLLPRRRAAPIYAWSIRRSMPWPLHAASRTARSCSSPSASKPLRRPPPWRCCRRSAQGIDEFFAARVAMSSCRRRSRRC